MVELESYAVFLKYPSLKEGNKSSLDNNEHWKKHEGRPSENEHNKEKKLGGKQSLLKGSVNRNKSSADWNWKRRGGKRLEKGTD